MSVIFLSIMWCAVHFALFLLQRGNGLLAPERAIFLFHIVSIIGLAVLLAFLMTTGLVGELAAVGALSLHGIYSLTFLELWSLTEGGYTVGMLRMLRGGGAEEPDLLRMLASVGEQKRSGRIESLQRRRLIERTGNDLILTRLGRTIRTAIRLLRWCANAGNPG